MARVFYAARWTFISVLFSTTTWAEPLKNRTVDTSQQAADIAALRTELAHMRSSYESRIAELENKLMRVESAAPTVLPSPTAAAEPAPQNTLPAAVAFTPAVPPAAASTSASANAFNPAIGLVLNGGYKNYSRKNSEFAGFGVGDEGVRGKQGFSLGESELSFAAPIDDKFAGRLTLAVLNEDGQDNIETEEAFIRNQPGKLLPAGASFRAGRALWTLGYLNEQHTHTDDFSDRPLPYRAFLNNAYNDDGAELNWILPLEIYTEIGGGLFRGDAFPFGDASGNGAEARSAYGRVGGDIGENQSWRVGAYRLDGHADNRQTNDKELSFKGDSALWISDVRYTWTPDGNRNVNEVTAQAEYFHRDDDGSTQYMPSNNGYVDMNNRNAGWYLQSAWRFLPQWKTGIRYSRLDTTTVAKSLMGSPLEADGFNPNAWALMLQWDNSEFSRIRLQFNREELARGNTDNQILLNYTMSLGAHGAHNY